MGAAALAHDLRAPHEERVVRALLHLTLAGGLIEARPAGAGIELGVGVEQLLTAHDAAIHAVLVAVVVLAGERTLRPGLLGYVVLLLGEPLAQLLGVGLLHTFEATDAGVCYSPAGWRATKLLESRWPFQSGPSP